MNAVVGLVRVNTRRFWRERSNLFFVVLLPLLIVFALGTMFSGGAARLRVGVADPAPSATSSALAARAAALQNVSIVRYTSAAALRDDVGRKVVDVGWSSAVDGPTTRLTWFSSTSGEAFRLRAVIEAEARRLGLEQAAVELISTSTGQSRQAASAALAEARVASPPTPVTVTDVTRTAADDPHTIRSIIAGGELTLFVFLSTLAGSQYLLLSRKAGVTRRTMAAPVRAGEVIVGEAISRMVTAVIQAAVIIAGCAVLFGIEWHSIPIVAGLAMCLAAVAAGLAMIVGTVARSEQQAGALSIFGSMVLGALGGSMQPLHFFPHGLRTAALCLTPHAWMNDALWKVIAEGRGVGDVWLSFVVLIGAAIVTLLIAARLIRTRLR